jgi:hypothetical protein
MLGCMGNFGHQDADANTTAQDVYIHGYVSGRMFKKAKEEGDEGLPMTIAASYVPPISCPYLHTHYHAVS